MAYNNYYPVTYYQHPQQTYYQPQQQQSSIIWVNSEIEAQNYPVAPNNAVALWDSNKAAIYLKQTDASGRPTFKAFDLVEHKIADLSQEKMTADNFISKADLEALRGDLTALMAILKEKREEQKDDE